MALGSSRRMDVRGPRTMGFAGTWLESYTDYYNAQTLAGILWMIGAAYINALSQVYVDKFQKIHAPGSGVVVNQAALADVGFYLLPEIEFPHLCDYVNIVIIMGTMIPIILFHPFKAKITRRFLFVQGAAFMLRAITIVVTLLPNPYSLCTNVASESENPFIEAAKITTGQRFTCGDVLFSGHSANFTFMCLIWQEYSESFPAKRKSKYELIPNADSPKSQSPEKVHWFYRIFLRVFAWVCTILGYLIIIASRFHYTVDVLVAILVCTTFWNLYHLVVRTPILLEQFKFLQWYEQKGEEEGGQIYLPHCYEEAKGGKRRTFGTLEMDKLEHLPSPTCMERRGRRAELDIGVGLNFDALDLSLSSQGKPPGSSKKGGEKKLSRRPVTV